jgi:hypothetical protein
MGLESLLELELELELLLLLPAEFLGKGGFLSSLRLC